MQVDSRIVVTLTSRLYADEISKLQERVGSVVPLKDSHRLQNLNSVGMYSVYMRNVAPDFVAMFSYLSEATLAILDEVTPDTLVFSRLDHSQNYELKNVYYPSFAWHSHTLLTVVPPVFGREAATVALESNGFEIVFPVVMPHALAQAVLQKLMLYNIYARLSDANVGDVNMDHVRFHATTLHHMGRAYTLHIDQANPGGMLGLLDNLAIYLAIISALLPNSLARLLPAIMRHEQHELLNIFAGVAPPDDGGDFNIEDDMQKMESFMAYMQSVSSIFNLGPKLRLGQYSSETQSGTAWLAS
ncbi:capsid triplex subunit 2 [Equid gammaherpesvirus 2]|uniref:Triplex capsid protein 2 n=2 Tax=Equid gammaherpesvirus 2 TaxID=12657 RepID=TRX2_EHV2|nr:capsid triplex subunit 2 [Equid gammaherpesvirus 2]Q66629.1 RecName: Full=Triplex capsid protein 2 [Equid herpesvirus type 2 strain 86/87]AAC13813.1 capsid triplex subunit 2 [Equid gammaherpesvirus 2]AIU39472.1 capsid triplex subunit 2 [Equid gammaherpesvirus 2]UTM04255.1 capsid triplex subunit 2 [Equid gammaherpesvirus 2]UTM04412.1 capsid triplex subunit 2 [Equid gammaherpesvirus 2]UTM04806.1 capsid triplex subunit 2 [Equid gammaherpesvirus 2]